MVYSSYTKKHFLVLNFQLILKLHMWVCTIYCIILLHSPLCLNFCMSTCSSINSAISQNLQEIFSTQQFLSKLFYWYKNFFEEWGCGSQDGPLNGRTKYHIKLLGTLIKYPEIFWLNLWKTFPGKECYFQWSYLFHLKSACVED